MIRRNCMKTGYIYDESYFWHDTGSGTLFLPSGGYLEKDVFSEDPATKRRVNNLMERCGIMKKLKRIDPRPATLEEIKLFHTTNYIEKVKLLSDTTGGDAGDHAIVGRGSYEIALLSTGGAITAVDAVMQSEVENAYALTRPPGHHAEADMGIGFCIFNNVAIAAKYAREKYGLDRIMILDWDVHHGNGTEKAFYHDPNVLFISIHEDLNFPDNSGYAEDVGEDSGRGFNVNIPLPPGTGNAGYLEVFKSIIAPLADDYKPQLIIVSAGQDPSIYDPLGRMRVTAEGFGKMTELMMEIAEKHCNKKIVFCHEGGYSNAYVPFCTLRIIETLSGIKTDVVDPFVAGANGYPDYLYEHQKNVINKVIEIQSEYWSSLKVLV